MEMKRADRDEGKEQNRVRCERSNGKIGIPFEDDTFFREFHWDIKSRHKEIALRIFTLKEDKKKKENHREMETEKEKKERTHTHTYSNRLHIQWVLRKADGSCYHGLVRLYNKNYQRLQ